VIRAILYLVGAVLAISVIRAVVGILSKGFADLFSSSSTSESGESGPRTRTSHVPSSEALKKDPVCGTFIAPSTAVTQTVGGETYYFCSAACRDQFKRTA